MGGISERISLQGSESVLMGIHFKYHFELRALLRRIVSNTNVLSRQ